MRKYLKMIRRGDLLIILFLMAASFLPLGVFSYHQANAESADHIAVISVEKLDNWWYGKTKINL